MSQGRRTAGNRVKPASARLANSYYALLGVHPSASALDIRRAYRELSKLYHPDTTKLSPAIAKAKFQQLNEAYATLSDPEQRRRYDLKICYPDYQVVTAPQKSRYPAAQSRSRTTSAAYLDDLERPLSAGEVFALFILGLTFLGCLLLAITIGLTRGDAAFQVPELRSEQVSSQQQPAAYHLEALPEPGSTPQKLDQESTQNN